MGFAFGFFSGITALILLVQRDGGLVVNVPVNHRPRAAGRSKYGVMNRLWVGIVDLFGVMWLNRRMTHPRIDE